MYIRLNVKIIKYIDLYKTCKIWVIYMYIFPVYRLSWLYIFIYNHTFTKLVNDIFTAGHHALHNNFTLYTGYMNTCITLVFHFNRCTKSWSIWTSQRTWKNMVCLIHWRRMVRAEVVLIHVLACKIKDNIVVSASPSELTWV